MNVPWLRFKEFSGEWSFKKLGTETKWNSGGTPSKQIDSYWGGDIPWISASSMRGFKYFDSDLKITEDGLLNGSKLASKGTLLLLVRGSMLFNKIPVGIAIRDVAFNQDVKSITAQESIKPEFLLYWFLASENILLNMVSGTGIGAGKLDTQDLLAMDLRIPPIEEQTKIANFLTAVDEKIAQLTQKVELLARYKKGVMQQIFSQQLRFKDDDGRDFPDWEDSKLTDVATIVGGGTPDTTVKKYWNGEIQWFTPTELKTKYMSKSLRTITESGLKNSSAKILPVGTLLFSSRATVGDISIALNECTTNQGFQSFIVNNENCNKFVYYWILNNKNVFLEKASGSTFLEISKKEIEKLKIKTPSILEQTKIANFLTAIDDKISHNQTQLNVLKQYKQGLLQQLFV